MRKTSFRKFGEKHIYWLDFILVMTEKEIKAGYKHAVLGFLWIVLNPLLQMVVIGFIFQFFVPVKVNNYFLFLFTGLLPWNFCSFSVSRATTSIVYERSLIKKANFPREAIVLSIVLASAFHFMISLLILMLFLLINKVFIEHSNLGQLIFFLTGLLWLVPAIIWLVVFTSAISLLLATLNVRYRDVNFFVKAAIPLWFYAAPIVYTLNLIPQRLQVFLYLNPLTPIVQLFQYALLGLSLSSLWLSAIGFIITCIVLITALIQFRKDSPYFDDWL